ncbi:MAG: STAS domain-containing protein [Planctomycetota bacterium]|nr:STAS domain-containing protein [Planctomycetota bacterium]
MHRRLIIITKDPEFDDRGEVVLGQCEPFTSAWRLILVHPNRQQEELLSGTYTDLRKIQESCTSIEEPEKVRKRVNEMRALINSSVTETVAVEFDEEEASGSTKILDPTQTDFMPVVTDQIQQTSGDGFFELNRHQGAIVALVADPERASDVALLNQQLRKLLEQRPKAIVLDLSRIQNLATRALQELCLFRDQCESDRIQFGLCNLRKSVQKLIETLGHTNPPHVYDTPESALAEIVQSK